MKLNFRSITQNSIVGKAWIIIPALGGLLVLITVFAVEPSLKNGLVMGKVFWFHKAVFLFSIMILVSFLIKRYLRNTRYIKITLPDILLLIIFGITLLTYNWQLHPEPEKLLFGGQLIALWFILRILLKGYPALKLSFLVFIMLTGLIQSIWGLEQLYGYRSSHHSLFRLTGSFFNPGPYSGYLAVLFPVALNFILQIGKFKKYPWWHYTTVLYYTSWLTLISMLLVLPAGMSRSAWLAAGISCVWVYWINKRSLCSSHTPGPSQEGNSFNYYKWLKIVFIICILVVGLGILFFLKKDSANGRLLMWKITAQAITHQPVSGTGLGGFPAAFAKEQAAYFVSGNASATEKLVAGSPEYAFNEYLQIGLEQGVSGLMCFLLWLFYCFYAGIKNRRIGAAGGILAIIIFSSSSYPLQLPSFWILLIFLSVICVAEPCSFIPKRISFFKVNALFVITFSTLLSGTCYLLQQKYYPAYKEWISLANHTKLYPLLNHKPEYLFDYAQYLNRTGDYQHAYQVLERATQLSADPMIWYMMGKNAQALEDYEEAEKYLLHGINILPERIYPYYLLTKLYVEPAFYNPQKLHASIDSVLTKEPKVQTTAILEMREEVNKLFVRKDNESDDLTNNK